LLKGNHHILNVDGLKTHFHTLEGIAKAVDDVSFHASAGETLGIVGESGSGKSVSALSIMRLIKNPPGKIVDGRIEFAGTDLLNLSEKMMRKIRGNRISMIFQEPMTSPKSCVYRGEPDCRNVSDPSGTQQTGKP
jgi:ABC-type dipeptide/oligopeptide/nickel transport system ATPase component